MKMTMLPYSVLLHPPAYYATLQYLVFWQPSSDHVSVVLILKQFQTIKVMKLKIEKSYCIAV
jgi:hypothetical protein